MSKTDHLARAKDYIAKGDEFYEKAADEIIAWLAEDDARTHEAAAEHLGRSRSWISKLVRARTEGRSTDWGSGSNKRDDVTRTTLSNADEATVEEIVAALPPKAVERIAEKATHRLVENARSRRAEHNTEPTVNELTGGERFNPAEFWADTLIIRVNRNAHELDSLLQRGGGLRLGTMPIEEAFEYLQDAERLIAEARAAAQESAREVVA